MYKYNETPRIQSPARTKHSKLLLCTCSKNASKYFVRIDKKNNEDIWHAAYAFPYKVSMKSDSCIMGHDEEFELGENLAGYQGCPYCGNYSINFCNCGAIFCSNSAGKLRCPVCGKLGDYFPDKLFKTKTTSL